MDRGWASVEARVGKRKFRFVDTHLEAFGDPKIREAQAKELTKGPLKTKTQVVLVGDLNSGIGRHNEPEKPGDDLAFKALDKFGFKDNGARQSCCFDSLFDANATFDHTVDHVLTKPGLTTTRASVTGRDAERADPVRAVAVRSRRRHQPDPAAALGRRRGARRDAPVSFLIDGASVDSLDAFTVITVRGLSLPFTSELRSRLVPGHAAGERAVLERLRAARAAAVDGHHRAGREVLDRQALELRVAAVDGEHVVERVVDPVRSGGDDGHRAGGPHHGAAGAGSAARRTITSKASFVCMAGVVGGGALDLRHTRAGTSSPRAACSRRPGPDRRCRRRPPCSVTITPAAGAFSCRIVSGTASSGAVTSRLIVTLLETLPPSETLQMNVRPAVSYVTCASSQPRLDFTGDSGSTVFQLTLTSEV